MMAWGIAIALVVAIILILLHNPTNPVDYQLLINTSIAFLSGAAFGLLLWLLCKLVPGIRSGYQAMDQWFSAYTCAPSGPDALGNVGGSNVQGQGWPGYTQKESRYAGATPYQQPTTYQQPTGYYQQPQSTGYPQQPQSTVYQ